MEHVCVCVNVLGPFPITDNGNRHVPVAMEYFMKWPEAYGVPDQTAATTVEKLVQEMLCRFSAPEDLHSDQGRNLRGPGIPGGLSSGGSE